jgi:hypothetical protein
LFNKKQWGGVKGKVVPVYAMKTSRGSCCIAPLFLNLSSRWRWVVNFMPLLFNPFKELRYPFTYEAGVPQSQSGRFWRRESVLPLLDLNPGLPSLQPSLYQLHYPGSHYEEGADENCHIRWPGLLIWLDVYVFKVKNWRLHSWANCQLGGKGRVLLMKPYNAQMGWRCSTLQSYSGGSGLLVGWEKGGQQDEALHSSRFRKILSCIVTACMTGYHTA